ncbi:MAG: spore coat protein [Clostridia bacterium]|nr:spore coat protein [Clostridia bacterium]
MNKILESLTGMDKLSDQLIAADFLNAAKAGIKNYSWALSETATPEVRDTLRRQLDTAISTHERITNYMLDKGYYHAYDPSEQIKLDMKAAETAMNLPS